jgi:hypothetical protein
LSNLAKVSWRVEIEEWRTLDAEARRDVLLAAGDLGAEWWSPGWLVFEVARDAFACIDECRARGYRCRLQVVA